VGPFHLSLLHPSNLRTTDHLDPIAYGACDLEHHQVFFSEDAFNLLHDVHTRNWIGLDFFVTFLGFDHLGNFLLSGFGSLFVLGWVGLV
jgi:hypothetical protein